MLNNNFDKGVSIIEALLATFILGVIALFFINSSTIFIGSQQAFVDQSRKDQMADLILQDIMEYVKIQNSPYGTIIADAQTFSSSTSISVSGFSTDPKVGDIFLVDGLSGRYKVQSVQGTGSSRTITADASFPNTTIDAGTTVTFIAFKKADLSCFDGLNLNASAPSTLTNCSSVPSEVQDLHNHWKAQIESELGSDITTRTIEVTDEGLVKVTLGNGTENTILAKKINNCLFSDSPKTVGFTFPGLDDSVITGIMEGSENPVAHYYANGKAKYYPNLDNNNGSVQDMTVSCSKTKSSSCRQTYAGSNAITVFLYKYTGSSSIRARPSDCSGGLSGWQCPGVRIDPNDISLWFIFDEYNHSNDSEDTTNVGQILSEWNKQGYFTFDISNLPTGARILVFDDDSESCQNNITNNTCSGRYKWGKAHDGLVIHLNTSDVKTLNDIELEITGVPYGVNRWRILKSTPSSCLIASDDSGSAHQGEWHREDDTCWQYVSADTTTLTASLSAGATSLTAADSSIFPSSGNIQVGSEYIGYTSNDTSTNTISGIQRGIRQIGKLTSTISSTESVNFTRTLSGQNTQIGFWGGYVQIENEIFKVDYNGSFDDFDNNILQFTARAQKGTSAATHTASSGSPLNVVNYDMRDQSHSSGTTVYEGPTHALPVVQAEDNGAFPRVRIKKRVTLNLSSSEVCQ